MWREMHGKAIQEGMYDLNEFAEQQELAIAAA
jgi:hypothetical protein